MQLNGEYGVENVYAGVPVVIGKDGVEKIEVVDLDEKENKEFMHSIEASIECINSLFSFSSKSTTSIFSTPSLPITTGTPA